jgi:hypothetical protein
MEFAPNPKKLAARLKNATPGEFRKLLEKYQGYVVHFVVHPEYIDIHSQNSLVRAYHKQLTLPFKSRANFENSVFVVGDEGSARSLFKMNKCNFIPQALINSESGGIPENQARQVEAMLRNPKVKVAVFTGLIRKACMETCKASVEKISAGIGRGGLEIVENARLAMDLERLGM